MFSSFSLLSIGFSNVYGFEWFPVLLMLIFLYLSTLILKEFLSKIIGKLAWRALDQFLYGNLQEFLSTSIGYLSGVSIYNPWGVVFKINRKLVWIVLGQFLYRILKECLAKSIGKLVCWALGQFPNIILKGVLSKSIEQVFGSSKWNPLGVPYKSLGNWSGALNFHMESSRNSFQDQ